MKLNNTFKGAATGLAALAGTGLLLVGVHYGVGVAVDTFSDGMKKLSTVAAPDYRR